MKNYDPDLSQLVSYFTDNEEVKIDISKQFRNSSDPLNKLNAAFLLILSSQSEQSVSDADNYLQDCLNKDETREYARFYKRSLDEISEEFSNYCKSNPHFDQYVSTAVSAIETNESNFEIQEYIWQIFFPEAEGIKWK